MQKIVRAREICKLVLQMGPYGPHSVSTFFQTLRVMVPDTNNLN